MNGPQEKNRTRIERILNNTSQLLSQISAFELEEEDFESGQDSTTFVRERARETKLDLSQWYYQREASVAWTNNLAARNG